MEAIKRVSEWLVNHTKISIVNIASSPGRVVPKVTLGRQLSLVKIVYGRGFRLNNVDISP